MTPEVRDFKALIHWLADKHHDGAIYPMAERIGISSALADKWAHGTVKQPSVPSLRKLCRAYHLDFMKVLQIVERGRGILVAFVLFLAASGLAWSDAPYIDDVREDVSYHAPEVCVISTRDPLPWWENVSPPVGRVLTVLHLMFYALRSILTRGGVGAALVPSRPLRRPVGAGACA